MFTLRTNRLVLRPFRIGDAAAFAAYRSDPEVARYQSWSAPYRLEAARELIGQMVGRTRAEVGAWNQIAIEDAEGAGLIGDCAFRLDSEEQATIGFTVARAHQGRGYATEAARGLAGQLFAGMRLERVRAECDAENVASQRVLERVGMRREAHYAKHVLFKGAWGNEWAYAVLRTEWGS